MESRINLLILTIGMLVFITICSCKRKLDSPKAKPQTIYEAAKIGDKAAIEEFLAQGTRIDGKDRFGLTPLHWATWYGNTEVVKLLLVKGADIHAKCREGGMTPLHYAAAYCHKEIAELLISNGADINARNKGGGTPLSNAAMGTGHNKEVAELLIANGADVNTKNFDGRTPLHNAVINRQPEILILLLSKGADATAKDGDGKTALERAIILSETKFRRGSIQAKQRKKFEDCADILRQYEAR